MQKYITCSSSCNWLQFSARPLLCCIILFEMQQLLLLLPTIGNDSMYNIVVERGFMSPKFAIFCAPSIPSSPIIFLPMKCIKRQLFSSSLHHLCRANLQIVSLINANPQRSDTRKQSRVPEIAIQRLALKF